MSLDKKMGAGSFKADVSGTFQSCMKCDDGTIGGCAGAAWSLVNCFPPACIWHLFMCPAYHVPGDILPFGVAALLGIVALPLVIGTFVVFLVPGLLAAGIGAIVGLCRR